MKPPNVTLDNMCIIDLERDREHAPQIRRLVQMHHDKEISLRVVGARDALYEIIYEGSGSLKRIPESFKGNPDFIGFTIKFLRADLRHDIAHGDEKEIKAKKERVSQIYTKYCGKPSLGILESSDFHKIQIEILVEVQAFLTALKQYLMDSPGTALLHDQDGLS